MAKTPPQGFSHPLCLLNSVPFDPCSTGHSSASFFLKKTTPQKCVFTSWTQMIPEPNNMAGCPLCPPQHCLDSVGEGLVVACVDLVPVSCSPKFSVLEKYKAQGEQSGMRVLILSCPWVGFEPFAYFVAWDVFSCRKTELCLPNLFPVTVSHKHILNTSPYYSRIKTWLGRSKDHILKFKMPYLQGKYFCYQPVLFFIFKKSFLLNRHLRSC